MEFASELVWAIGGGLRVGVFCFGDIMITCYSSTFLLCIYVIVDSLNAYSIGRTLNEAGPIGSGLPKVIDP